MVVTVSAVVPTRNRPESLERALRALRSQTRPPLEILVVDASDGAAEGTLPGGQDRRGAPSDGVGAPRSDPPVRVIAAPPGVCGQRNLGIGQARGSWILLLDDDVEPAPDYLERLLAHVESDPDSGACTGVIVEPDRDGEFGPGGFPTPSLRHLLFAFAFQTSVFGNAEAVASGALARPLVGWLKGWYRRRGNTWSVAGWPLVTQTTESAFRVSTYGLGAALVRRDWLLYSPFDESLGAHGIGDNYGVALGFPDPGGISILKDVPVRHHRSPLGRLDEAEASYRRALALDYFMRTSPRFTWRNRVALTWSLLGQAGLLAGKGRLASAAQALRAVVVSAVGANPIARGGFSPADVRRPKGEA